MKLFLLLPLFAVQISALVFSVPSNPVSGEETTISWTNDARDYTPWSIFLMNASETAFGLKGFLAHQVDASALNITLTLPVLPETEYRYILKGVRSDNVDWPVGWSPVFDIAQPQLGSLS